MDIIQYRAVFNKQCCTVGCNAMYETVYISSMCIVCMALIHYTSMYGFQAMLLWCDSYIML